VHSVTDPDKPMQATAADLARVRHKVYGLRVADDPQHPACFVVVCAQHKLIGANLTILQAREIMAEHAEGLHVE
jgi:hypothetical protein